MHIRHALALSAAAAAMIVVVGTSATSASAAVPVRGTFTPVDPVRIVDTRDGTGVAGRHPGPLGAGLVTEFVVTGVGTVPTVGVGAVVLNVTATEAAGPGYITVYPCGDARPVASNLNVVKGVDSANLVTAKVGRDGKVCVFASTTTQFVADLSGWYADDFAAVPGYRYTQLDPARIIDTRDGTGLGSRPVGPLVAAEILPFTIPGAGGVPTSGDVRAVTMNVTATDATAAGFISVFPCDKPRPVVSNVNVDPSSPTVANLATVRLSSTGQVCFFSSVATNLVVDVQGYFSSGPGVTFTSLTPARVLDTRDGTGIVGTRALRMNRGDVIQLQLQVAGLNGVPGDAAAVMMNVTITGANGPGYVTAWPCGKARPLASFLNFVHGVDRANLTPVRIGNAGQVCLYVSEGTDVIADLNGYFTPAAA